MPSAEMLMAEGATGVAVAAVVVVMLAGVLARLVCTNVKGPPKPPSVVFCSFSVAVLVLVNVQAIVEPGAVPKALICTEPVARLLVVLPVPVPVQDMLLSV